MTCVIGKLAGDITKNECYKPQMGNADELILLAFADLSESEVTFNSSNPIIVEALKAKVNTRGYKFEFLNNTLIPADEQVRDDSGVRFLHKLIGMIPSNTAATKLQLLNLSNTKVIAVLKSNYKGDENQSARFEIFGLESPLTLTVATNSEGKAMWNIELAQEAGYEAPTPVHTLFKTNLSTTQAIYDALLVEISG